MSQTEPPDLSKLVGFRMRVFREHRSQEEVAEAARGVGLSWTRSVVASIENGHRSIRLEEFLVLPVIFRELGEKVELSDLLPLRGRVTIEEGTWNIGTLRRIMEGLGDRPARPARPTSATTSPWVQPLDWNTKLLALLLAPDDPAAWLDEVLRYARGEAEQKAARKFDVDPSIIAAAAIKLWGRGLTQERDARVLDHELWHETQPSKRSIQARRGRITRELLAEIEELLGRVKGD